MSSLLCVEKTNGEVNISHETTYMVVWIYCFAIKYHHKTILP